MPGAHPKRQRTYPILGDTLADTKESLPASEVVFDQCSMRRVCTQAFAIMVRPLALHRIQMVAPTRLLHLFFLLAS